MTDGPGSADNSSTRRPKDRRLIVAREAAEMFSAHGFAAVRMDDIARAVGVTARALYRHYPGKHDLLLAVALAAQDNYYTALAAADTAGDARHRFRSAIAALVEVTLDGRSHAVLWQREARHLHAEQRAIVRGRLTEIAHRIAELIGRCRDRPADDPTVELLAWAVLSVVTSPGHHTRTLPRPDSDQLLMQVADALAQLELPPRSEDTGSICTRPLSSRRERIIQESARLFAERGYPAVSVEDIGEAAGILGPSVYHYFPSKQQILHTLIHRVYEWMTFGLVTAGETGEPNEAVVRMTDFYVSFALRFPDLTGIAVTEALYLGEAEAETLRRIRFEFVTEWADLLTTSRPEISPSTAAQIIEIVLALVDDLARTPHIHSAGIADQMNALAGAVISASPTAI
ncbi:TetR/AcrR family transcriptional regulator [Nocardia speluncae]|uniref:TetR/AcrR family transcriptional regulator n=1 Tax=Nocardia speluncae TaxID=419477 RepID=A0A846X8T8_9NOCA|nr:TetR/AcrR family transcriptional regulator [Nocardia speluncae]NKY32398.1 TetR/AcrR family transcriptional regulator [Nocardia speluncae]